MRPEDFDTDFPWSPQEDESFRAPERRWVRSWRGMPPRKEWNESPIHSDGVLCPHCGYKWNAMDIMQPSGLCWNCNFIETNPNAYANAWRSYESLKEKKEGAEPVLAPLQQDSKPKRFK